MPEQPGFKKLKVPGRNELRPHQRDSMPERGVLSHVKSNIMVHDVGAPRDALTEWRGTPSPSSPTFKAGEPLGVNPTTKRPQQSLPIQTGRTNPTRDKKANPES